MRHNRRRPMSDDGRRNRIGGRWLHYDRAGEPIEWNRWAELFEDRDYQRIARTELGDGYVSTVWLGIDHNWTGTGPPVIFETMVFGGGDYDSAQVRYCTEAEAIDGHARTVEDVRARRPLWFDLARLYQEGDE